MTLRSGGKTKKLWLSIIPAQRLSEQRFGTTPKRCELQLFFAAIRQAIRRWKAIHLRRLNMQFQQDWPKDKTITGLSIFGGKLRKIRSTDLNGAPLEGSTNFLCRSSFGLYVNGKLSIS